MLRLAYTLLAGLVGAGIVHIAVLMMLPQFSEGDAWSRLSMQAGPFRIVQADSLVDASAIVAPGDPLFMAALCRFDLSQGMAHVRAIGRVPFWSVSVYDRGGQNVYSLNDRASQDGTLDLVVLQQAQMIEVRKFLPEDMEQSIFVETPVEEGIVALRAFVPDATWRPRIAAWLSGLSCDPK